MHKRTIFLTSSTLAACAAAIALLWLLGGGLSARAAPAAELHVCPSGCVYSSVQAAVDAANPDDVVKVAQGTYTDVHNVASLNTATFTATQIVAITKSVTIQGGYTTTNWTTPDPAAHPTTLDAQGLGRVLYVTGDITPTIEGLRITGGDADGLGGCFGFDAGGGVYIVNASATISDNQIFSNIADSSGGGVYLQSSDASLSYNVVFSNTADNGDGLRLYASPATLSNNVIRNNGDDVSGWGGGVYLGGSAATLHENIVTNNIGGYGGGVSVHGSTAVLQGNIITGNTGYRGGGLFLYTGSVTVISDNVITGNTASDQGGGVYFWRNSSTLINTVVADNHLSSGLGAGLYLDGASAPRLLHVTIARNSGGDGSGVYVTNYGGSYSTVAMTNTIIVSHTVGITVTAGNTATLNGTLWHANTITQSGKVIHTNDRSGDPAFAPDGYHLTLGSAAIDQGMSAGVTTDIDGQARDANPDIGADEYYYPALAVSKQASPDPVQAGAQLTYTIRVTNTGSVDLHAIVTDTLPAQVTPGGVLTWTLIITAPGSVWTQQVIVTVTEGYSGTLTNVVRVTTAEGATGIYTETSTAQSKYRIYLPLVLRN